jgi:hypothetical protein
MFPNSLANNKVSVFVGPSVIFNIPVLSDNRPTESSFYPRADLGISYPVRIGMGKYLLDLVYGFGVTSVIQGDLPMDQWYDSLHRQTLALRLHLY